jgi:hypothetical protein
MKNPLNISKKYKISAMLLVVAVSCGALFAQGNPLQPAEEAVSVPAVEYKAGMLRDPFQGYKEEKETAQVTPEAMVKPLPALTVQGIVWGGSMPQAIINNKVLKEGDVIDEVKITKINKEGIEVFYTGRPYVISSPASNASSSLSLLKKTGQ